WTPRPRVAGDLSWLTLARGNSTSGPSPSSRRTCTTCSGSKRHCLKRRRSKQPMGLCINYSLSSDTKSAAQSESLVNQMRQLALDLPFQKVGNVVCLEGDECDLEQQRGTDRSPHSWLIVRGCHYMDSP